MQSTQSLDSTPASFPCANMPSSLLMFCVQRYFCSTLFGVFLVLHRCGWNDAERYVVQPYICFLYFCMYEALTLVMLLWSCYLIKFSVLLTLLFFFHAFF